MEIPLVSVIIPCYNQGKYLKTAIESVLEQTYCNWEIIVVDDGSKDDTRDIAKRFTEARYFFQENQGASAARNQGISVAKGKYLVFLDADDKLLSNALEIGVCALENHERAGMTVGRAYCQDDRRHIKLTSPELITCSYADLLRFNPIWHPACTMLRAEAMERIGNFDTTLVNCGDYDIYLRLARIYPIHCSPEFVSTYIYSENSLSTNRLRAFTYMFKIRRSHLKYVRHDRNLLRAYREGNSFYEDYYGIPLFSKMLDTLKRRDFKSPFLRELLRVFLTYHPRWFTGKVLTYLIAKLTRERPLSQVE
jgi:glycosyltransferase involved in cell wall biosynthesis